MFSYRSDSPIRPTDWSWHKARLIKEYHSKSPNKKDDSQYIKIAAKFRTERDECKDELDMCNLYERYPDLSAALELYDEEAALSGGQTATLRSEVEARILAREPLEEIAKKVGMKLSALVWYEKLFFNVLDRIDNRPWILHFAVGPAIHRGLSDREVGVLWRLYGYVKGVHFLEFIITTFSDWGHCAREDVENTLVRDHRTSMRRKAALSSRMAGLNSHSHERLIELHTKIVEVENKAAETIGTIGNEQQNQNIQVMLSHLPLLVGQQINQTNNVLAQYSSLTGDLRASEMLSLTAGLPVDKAPLTDFKFPEPLNSTQKAN